MLFLVRVPRQVKLRFSTHNLSGAVIRTDSKSSNGILHGKALQGVCVALLYFTYVFPLNCILHMSFL